MKRKERRKASRRPVAWVARYQSDGGRDGWSRCDVVDVSEAGAGFVVSGDGVERHAKLTLELREGLPAPITLEGIVRHATMSPDGTMHIGVEFEPEQPSVVILKVTEELGSVLGAV